MRAANENRLANSDIQDALNRCVQCHACETSCPSNVQYHELLVEHLPPRNNFVGKVMASKTMSSIAGVIVRFGAKLKLNKLPGVFALLPDKAHAFSSAQTVYPAAGELRAKVGVHLGCVESQIYADVIDDLIAVFTHQGFELHFADQPSCCGAIHAHNSDLKSGNQLAAQTSDAFIEFDNVITLSAGCSAHLQTNSSQARFLDPLVFLAENGLRGQIQQLDSKIAWVVPCHLLHLQQNWQAISKMLSGIPGVELLDFKDSDLCCGAGGSQLISQPQLVQQMGREKSKSLIASGAEEILVSNSGCRLQIDRHLRAQQHTHQSKHPLQLLRLALGV
jgi:glycolate oxidase iron-sulfur subunit